MCSFSDPSLSIRWTWVIFPFSFSAAPIARPAASPTPRSGWPDGRAHVGVQVSYSTPKSVCYASHRNLVHQGQDFTRLVDRGSPARTPSRSGRPAGRQLRHRSKALAARSNAFSGVTRFCCNTVIVRRCPPGCSRSRGLRRRQVLGERGDERPLSSTVSSFCSTGRRPGRRTSARGRRPLFAAGPLLLVSQCQDRGAG